MTNQVSVLESKIEVLQEQIQSIKKERWEVQEKFEKSLTTSFSKYFRGIVSEDIKVYCSTSSIQFKKMNDEGTYEKELFNIYLRERWSREAEEGRYTGAELSYYTTSTQSDFELTRLEALGKVAFVMRKCKEEIIERANALAKVYHDEVKQEDFYKKEYEVENQIGKLRNEIYAIKKGQKLAALFSEEGLTFEKRTTVKLKSGFEPAVSSLKLTDIAKSGKTATAIFTYYNGDYTSKEERVSIEKVVAQVI
jgi:hypothetical protein